MQESFLDKLGQHPKELNPYWKDGGSGLPTAENNSTHPQSKLEGRGWILRSYKRALEQAEQKKVPFKEIAEKQWGSVDKIYSLLRSAGIDPANPDGSFSSSKDKLLYSRSRYDEAKSTVTSDFNPKEHFCGRSLKSSAASKSFLRPGDMIDVDHAHSDVHNWKVGPKKSAQPQALPHPHGNVQEEVAPPTSSARDNLQEERKADLSEVTEAMINAASAKLIKAELLGNKEKIRRLQLELDNLRSRKKVQESSKELPPASSHAQQSEEKTVLLTTTDRFGRVRPAEVPYVDKRSHRARSSKGKSRRVASYDDYSMSSLMEQERKLTADDTYEAIAQMASKFVRSNPEDVVDDVVDIATKSNPARESGKMKIKMLAESRKMEEIMENCRLCVNGSNFRRHLVISMGVNAYLCVPPHMSLTSGHCMIVPLEHTPCSLQMDENVWSEVKSFQRSLTKMFDDHEQDVIFSECYTDPKRRSHMYIDCIPVPKDEGSMAPMYFKKAILESDSEWAQNKKLIDTRQKNVNNCVPLGLPYFYVDFNNEGGFAHVIEDASLFPQYFAKEVIGGIIDAEPRLWLKPPYENTEQQKRKSAKLQQMWSRYDWMKHH